jgi:hypothetical protein
MLAEDVSGRKQRRTKVAPESHINSQMVQLQPFDSAAKPPTKGPRVGPQTAPMPQTVIPYALFCGLHMSPMLAPPVASEGEPTKPVINRKVRSISRFTERAVGTCKTTKTIRVPI